eukprot:m.78552 g.78552  ORF g.78552 m.78552 type:complete len:62 (+) comp12675_c0_seq4:3243-3428(+)
MPRTSSSSTNRSSLATLPLQGEIKHQSEKMKNKVKREIGQPWAQSKQPNPIEFTLVKQGTY